ncbi:metal-dependent hydrolase (plasmid) [Pseudoalteromonas sp. KG3]|uniref:Metal-dependent hydrolase n=1 Tax=Pseudoalteromonas prydzensis TaxID=182141 RepID=A0ABR9FMN6_9GAMM|nr:MULTISPECIES: metal-dependent hydrolase [Pseudoalteromonas]MBE0458086.1 metal-dependent hydrolase [Pseudoalteromonas prydzensis]WKD26410.1 metal-dependent hydrolase [Pseudoalteromonas sp. KG3]
MPNAKTHMFIGAGVSLTTALLDNNKHPASHNVVVAPAVGAFMGKLPYILEPALHPNHRQFFHRMTVLTLLYAGLLKAYRWSLEEPFEKFMRGMMLICGGAYLRHLICDASTPKALPLVGKF